jgi:signal transduction histidine kinase
MPDEERGDQPERERTNATLRAERDKTDRELEARSATIADDAHAAVERARERAQIVLHTARADADTRMAERGASVSLRDAAVTERRAEDAALAAENATTDMEVERQRQRQQRALTRLLELERAETDLTLATERERADALVATRDDFLAMASHDLRTMLGGIALNAALLVEDAPADEAGRAVIRRADGIQRFTARMNRLVGDLVDVVSIEAGKLQVSLAPRDAGRLLRETLDTFQPAAAVRGVSVDGRVEPEAVLGRFDHDRILQVLGNLVSNAIRFTPAGGRISIDVRPDGSNVHFTVTDTGSGISEADIESIFERFRQAPQRNRVGLGLGLYIARCIVETHGGRLWAESVVGAGSTFHFTLPAAPVGAGE